MISKLAHFILHNVHICVLTSFLCCVSIRRHCTISVSRRLTWVQIYLWIVCNLRRIIVTLHVDTLSNNYDDFYNEFWTSSFLWNMQKHFCIWIIKLCNKWINFCLIVLNKQEPLYSTSCKMWSNTSVRELCGTFRWLTVFLICWLVST